MADRPLCFISYAQVDTDFVYDNIIPILKEFSIDIWIAGEQIQAGYSIADTIIQGIRKCDLVICLLNRRSTYVNLEIGAAIGNGKSVLAILNENYYELPADIKYLNYIRYNDNSMQQLSARLRYSIEALADTVIDKGAFAYNRDIKIIGIQAGNSDFESQLSFTADLIDFIKGLTGKPTIQLLQTSKGSLKSLISIDLKSWAELLEKVIFFIPELRKRKLDNLKVEAEIEKTKVETNQIDIDTKIKQVEAFLNIAERYQKLGFKIQIDDDLLIKQNESGQIIFKQPPRIE